MTAPQVIVQKYGGSTLETPEKIQAVAQKIAELSRSGVQVVAAVSAMGKTTNQLIDLAHQVSKTPSRRELDMLLSTGERVSMALMSMALQDLGISAISFTGSQAGILTTDSHINAQILDVKAFRVEEALALGKVVVLAGFQGVSPKTKEITTLGRGGTDTTAVAMAAYLKASRCEILKDVDGIYSADPKLISHAQVIRSLNYQQMLEMTLAGAQVLHSRSVEMAQEKNVPLWIGPAHSKLTDGTRIQSESSDKSDQALGLNSHPRVLQIRTQASSKAEAERDLNVFLDQFEIGCPQIFYFQDQTLWLAGPQEILSAIEKNKDHLSSLTLIANEFCSVSLTYSTAPSPNQMTLFQNKLKELQITALQTWSSSLSHHVILKNSDRKQALLGLHPLIKA